MTIVGVNRWLGAQRRAYSRWRGIRVAEQARLALADDARHAHGLAGVSEAQVPAALGARRRTPSGCPQALRPANGFHRRQPRPAPAPRRRGLGRTLRGGPGAGFLVLVASNPQSAAPRNPAFFAGLGCGTGVMCWWDAGEGVAQWALAVVLSLAVYALAHTVMIWAHAWHPNVVLALALPSGISCVLRLHSSRRAVAGEGPPEADVGDQ